MKLWNGVGGVDVRVNACVSLIRVIVKLSKDYNINCKNLVISSNFIHDLL